MIDAFDETSSFGCERRGYIKYVMGEPEPSNPSQALGVNMHKWNEAWLTGKENPNSPLGLDLHKACLPVLSRIKPLLIAAERGFSFSTNGVEVRGSIDLLLGKSPSNIEEVADWKTTSSFKRYAKTPEQLKNNTQMLLYGYAASQGLWAGYNYTSPLRLTHIYVQTRGPTLVESVSTQLPKSELAAGMEMVNGKVERIKSIVSQKSVGQVKADRSKCRMCPFFNKQCPSDGDDMVDFLVKSLEEEKSEEFSVLPPDAPAGDAVKAPVPKAEKKAAKVKKAEPVGVTFTGCTVAMGATVNTGNYNNVKLDIAISANITGDFDEGYAAVERKAKEKLLAAMEALPKKDPNAK